MSTHSTKSNYLNAILTVNAVLLAALVWTNIAGHSGGAAAIASPQSSQGDGGVPNAGLQRLDILNEVRAIRAELQQMDATISGGRMRVMVTNVDEFKIDYAKLRDAFRSGTSTGAATPPPTGSVSPATGAPPAPPVVPSSSVTPASEPAQRE